MSSISEIICQCVEALKTSSEEANGVTETILKIYENLENLPELFALNQQTEDRYVKDLVLIGIKNIVQSHLVAGDFPEEVLAFVKTAIVEGLQQNLDEKTKSWYCYIAGEIIGGENVEYPEIIELAGALLSDAQGVELGIQLWTQICKNINGEQMAPFVEPLSQSITAVLNSDNGNMRYCAAQLLYTIAVGADSVDVFAESQEFQEAIQAEYTRVINDQTVKEEERSQVIETVSGLLRTDKTINAILPSFQQLYHITLDGFYNEELPVMTRLDTLNFFNVVIETNPSLACSILDNIIEMTISLTVEQCNIEGRENFEPHYGDVTFQILASDEDIADDLICQVLTVGQETVEAAETDVTLFQVIIQLFASLADGAGEIIDPYEEDISPLFLAALQSEDESLISATCSTIISMLDTVPEFFEAKFGDYMQVLLQLAEHEDAIPTLDAMFRNVDVDLDNTSEVIQALIEIVGAETADPCNVIRCMSACISRADPQKVEAELYPSLREFLSPAIGEDQNVNEAVFECFSNCCQIAPKLVAEDLPALFEKMFSMLSPETIDSIPNISIAMLNFSRYYTVSIQPFIPQCAELLMQFLVNDVKRTDAMSSEEHIHSEVEKEFKIQGSVLNCLASFISSFPEEMSPYIEGILQITCQWLSLDEEGEDNVDQAAEAVTKMSPGLHAIELDPQELVECVLSAIDRQTDIDISNDLFLAIGTLLMHVGDKLNEECAQQVAEFFINILEGTNEVFIEKGEIIKEIQEGFFFALKCFILSGLVVKIGLEKTIEVLHAKISEESKPQMISLAVLALARIIYVNPEGKEELAQECVQVIATILAQGTKSTEVKVNFYSAVSYIACSMFAVFTQETLETIVASLTENISEEAERSLRFEAALALICIASNGVEVDIEAALSLMPPEADDDSVILFAKATAAIEQASPATFASAAVLLLASHDWILSLLPQEVVSRAVVVAQSQSEEYIDSILNGVEDLTIRMKSRLPQ